MSVRKTLVAAGITFSLLPLTWNAPARAQVDADTREAPEARPAPNESTRNSGTLKNALLDIVQPLSRSTARLRVDGKEVAVATVVDAGGLALTKASEIYGPALTAQLADGRVVDAELVGVIDAYDLAMVRLKVANDDDLAPVTLGSFDARVGQFAVSVGPTKAPIGIGVVSVGVRKIAGKSGLLGVELRDAPKGARVARVSDNSGAAKAGIQPDDVIVEIAGQTFETREAVVSRLRETAPGETIKLKIQRGEQLVDLLATLGERPDEQSARSIMQNQMGGELSFRKRGFARAIQHDTVLQPQDCGSPLVTLDGKVIGLNISRSGRVESYAIPSDALPPLIEDLKAGKYPIVFADRPKPATQPGGELNKGDPNPTPGR
jgi:S1-C subfamily serine protease